MTLNILHRRWSMKRWLSTIAAFLVASAASADEAVGKQAEKLLMGFEDAEVKMWADALQGVRAQPKAGDAGAHVVFHTGPAGSPGVYSWRIFKGKASQGDQAMGL